MIQRSARGSSWVSRKLIAAFILAALYSSPLLITAQTGTNLGSVSGCVILTSDFGPKATDKSTQGQVTILQTFLQERGYLKVKPTGYFGSLTMKAVQDFQRNNNVDPISGYVGPLTRAAIQKLTCSTITPSGNQRVGNIVVRLSPSSPEKRIVITSTLRSTPNVTLGIFDLKAEHQDIKVETIKFDVATSQLTQFWPAIFKNLYLTDGVNTYQASSIGSESVFTNLNINLQKDVWKSLTLKADIGDQDEFIHGTAASTTLIANTTKIVAKDSNGFTATAIGANATRAQDVIFRNVGGSITNQSTTIIPIPGITHTAAVEFKFRFNNSSESQGDIFISKNQSIILATTTNATSFALNTFEISPTYAGEGTQNYYIIPVGMSRDLTFRGIINNIGGSLGLKEAKITNIYYSSRATSLRNYYIDFGLETLKTIVVLSNETPSHASIDIKANTVTNSLAFDELNAGQLPFYLSWKSKDLPAGTICNASATGGNTGWSGIKQSLGTEYLGALSTGIYKFTITCGDVSDTALVVVGLDTRTAAPSVDISAGSLTETVTHDSLTVKGLPVQLSWTAKNVKTCSALASPANSSWNGILFSQDIDTTIMAKPFLGALPVGIHTYSISCTSSAGTIVADSVIVTSE
jgi:hypothetical protein